MKWRSRAASDWEVGHLGRAPLSREGLWVTAYDANMVPVLYCQRLSAALEIPTVCYIRVTVPGRPEIFRALLGRPHAGGNSDKVGLA